MSKPEGQSPMEEPAKHTTLDVRGGKLVSAFVLEQVVKNSQQVSELELITDAYQGLHADILAWGRLTGNTVTVVHEDASTNQKEHRYRIQMKKSSLENQKKKHLAIVISEDGLEQLISPLGFALSAACSGMDVSLYFQGPGVHVLHKKFKGRLSGFFRAPFSRLARNGMAAMGHLPPTKKIEQLHQLGAKFYACHPSLDRFGVPLKDTLFPDDIVVCEYATFLEIAVTETTTMLYP